MSTTYKVIAGDTFELVSRRMYGTENEAGLISQANPGVTTPLQAGVSLVIPGSVQRPVDRVPDLESSDPDEVAVRIGGERFRFWQSIKITRAIDSFDTVEVTAPFDSNTVGFRRVFRPFSFQEIDVTVGGVLLFVGTLISVLPEMSPGRKAVVASGYSLPGVLNDCTASASSFPLEFDNQNLRDIAVALAVPFGLSVEFQNDPGAVFERVTLAPGKKILVFLADLAKQRNLIISNTPAGGLLFWRSAGGGVPVADFKQGFSPLSAVKPQFNPQGYFSSITGIEPVFFGLDGSKYTVRNPHLSGVVRPHTFTINDTESAPVVDTVNAKIGRMFANVVAYSIGVATMRDPAGNVWAPGATVTLEAPDAMVYSKYEFTIRTVDITRTRSEEKAVLGLVLPGSFGGQVPEALPWD